ncbi:MAG TPA: deoxyhypusine synthase family protein [Dehalococcoidia bacterium]|nr:deoxyhypusine synthase family protein [Dehalococcoidia bacterium]
MPHEHEPRRAGEEGRDLAAADYQRRRAEFFTSPIERLEPRAGAGAAELFRAMQRAGGPLRNLAGVYLGWEEMLARQQQAIWLTIAGAYIPFGLGGTLRAIIEHRLVDVIVTTPAQITHDLTEVRGLRHYHGTPHVDDNLLQRLDINRYWNTYGDENELNENEDVIAEFADTLSHERAYTPSEYFWRLGAWLPQSRHGRADGMITAAARQGIPIFCPSPADGDITTDLAHYRKRTGRRLLLDPVKEALDTVAVNAVVEDAGGRAGLITLGGGAPRNYGQQSMACAYMLDRRDLQKHNYGLRISLDPVETGGLSGSTISEGKTWKKYAADATVAEHYGDFMVPLVQMTQALLEVRAGLPQRVGLRVRYAEDGRMLVGAFGGAEVDVQAVYGYA